MARARESEAGSRLSALRSALAERFDPPDNSLPYRPIRRFSFPSSTVPLASSALLRTVPLVRIYLLVGHLRSANRQLASSRLPFVPFRESNLLLCIANSEAPGVGRGKAASRSRERQFGKFFRSWHLAKASLCEATHSFD